MKLVNAGNNFAEILPVSGTMFRLVNATAISLEYFTLTIIFVHRAKALAIIFFQLCQRARVIRLCFCVSHAFCSIYNI